jgi:hypothetical protein
MNAFGCDMCWSTDIKFERLNDFTGLSTCQNCFNTEMIIVKKLLPEKP